LLHLSFWPRRRCDEMAAAVSVSLTVDGWTSLATEHFMAVTAHWIK
jgi:hypothetical protein